MVDLTPEERLKLKRQILFTPCKTKADLQKWISVFLGLEFPNCTVDEASNSNPMEMIWEVYSKALEGNDPKFDRVMYYASRDSFKSLGFAVLQTLAILHLDRSLVQLSAIEQQARKLTGYVKDFFNKQPLRDFVVGDNARELWVVRYYNEKTGDNLTTKEYSALPEVDKADYREIKHYDKIILATMRSANSDHTNLLCIDETDLIADPRAYQEAKLIPAPMNGKLPITVLTSTRKFSFGLVQKEIDDAPVTGLNIRHFNIIDVTEACPSSRHRPDLPKLSLYRSYKTLKTVTESEYDALSLDQKDGFVKDTGFTGCAKCPLFAMCKGRLATHQKSTSPLLKPIDHTINQFKAVPLEVAKAQLLCLKPSTEGLIYPTLDRETHMLSARAIFASVTGEELARDITKQELIIALKGRDVKWYSGLDFGFSHSMACSTAAVYGNKAYFLDAFAIPRLDPAETVSACEARIQQFDPDIFADPENPQMIKFLRKHGFRMKDWKKLKGSVVGGIEIFKMKLSPIIGEPQIYFLANDEGVEQLFQSLAKWHWKIDAVGKPTDVPSDDEKDLPDSARYLIMNVFSGKGRIIAPKHEEPVHTVNNQPVYSQENWMAKILEEKLGERDTQPTHEGLNGKKGKLRWDF